MKNTITLKDFKELANSDIVVFMQTNNKDWDVYATHNHETYKLIDMTDIKKYDDNQIDHFEAGYEIEGLKTGYNSENTDIIYVYLKN